MLTDADVTAAAHLAGRLAREAAAHIRANRPVAIVPKNDAADIATDADVRIERHVTSELLRCFPAHRVVGEELGPSGAAAGAPTWYLDPIDGTTNFAAGIPWCSMSLALADEAGPVVGVVADPFRDEVFAAARRQGATVNGAALSCSTVSELAGTVVLTELTGHRPWPGMYGMLTRLAARTCTVRVMGSSALSLVAVAAGRASGAVIGSYHDIDDLAGVLIAREAGAVVDGGPGGAVSGSAGLLVAAPGVADELSRCWHG